MNTEYFYLDRGHIITPALLIRMSIFFSALLSLSTQDLMLDKLAKSIFSTKTSPFVSFLKHIQFDIKFLHFAASIRQTVITIFTVIDQFSITKSPSSINT